MKYKFNYQDYAKRYYNLIKGKGDYRVLSDGKVKRFSPNLQYYSLNNDGIKFLFPRTAICFSFAITRDYKQKAQKFLVSRGFSNFEIIAWIRELKNSPVFINKNNGKVLIFDSPVGGKGVQLINSSIEQFSESVLFQREFYEEYISEVYAKNNGKTEIFEIDNITAHRVLTLFNKIRSIDIEAAKENNFWNSYISSDILCHEGHKMAAQGKLAMEEGCYKFSVETIPSVLELPAWKVLHSHKTVKSLQR